jgi:beta-lactamase class A
MVTDSLESVTTAVEQLWDQARCFGALHVRQLPNGPDVSIGADRLVVLASVFKVGVALEFYSQVATGDLDPTDVVATTSATRTAGPTGLSNFADDASVSLRDLAYLMLTISDNAATDEISHRVGLDAVHRRLAACGCGSTAVVSDLATVLDGAAADLGFESYRELLAAQSGERGREAFERSTDQKRIDGCSALDPARTTRSTPRDMTTLLAAIEADRAGPPTACAMLREVMGQQLGGRFAAVAPVRVRVAAKGGALFGRVRNEIALVTYPDDATFAVAVFTHAHQPFTNNGEINRAIGNGALLAIDWIRAMA